MKFRTVFVLLIFVLFAPFSFSENSARIWGDMEAAQQYACWAKQAMDEGRYSEALAGLERVADFANVSSDISFLLGLARFHEGKSRPGIIEALDKAIETNIWEIYDEGQALLLKAKQLVAMRKYVSAINSLDKIELSSVETHSSSAMVRLTAFKGMALGLGGVTSEEAAQAQVYFRNLLVNTMDRFPRDPRPLRIFFEYARNKLPEPFEQPESDLRLLELVLRRLPFLLESDPELAWMAVPFIKDTEDARRLLVSYRSGGIPHIQNRDFRPSPFSISAALNLGLISDTQAVEELFSGTRGINSPLPYGISADGNPVIDKDVIIEVYNMLRGEDGRNFFTQKLLSFTGCIISDDDNDGFIDSVSYYRSGVVREYELDRNQENAFDFRVTFSAGGVPVSAAVPVTGFSVPATVLWERYPFVERAVLTGETFSFRPADFQYAPLSFFMIGGSGNYTGIAYPVPLNQTDLTRRSMVSFCASITRLSVEFDGAFEQIFFERAVPVQAVESIDGMYVSLTEFDRGVPVVQYVDMNLDGRMETIRRFRRPNPQYPWPDSEYTFDYRQLIASSESDWTGYGRFKTGEVYLQDGSVVYLMDMNGSGTMNYSEAGSGNR